MLIGLRRWAAKSACFIVTVSASSQVSAQSERWLDTQTGWTYLYGGTSTQVNNLTSSGQRIFRIERTGSNAYDAIGVTNSGVYQVTGSTISYSQTTASLTSLLNSGRRIVDLEPYANGVTEIYAVTTSPTAVPPPSRVGAGSRVFPLSRSSTG